ncbi:hypothetical protein [Hymenobacter metallilatus]|uniref:Curlin n=1 Tax=Hymenobacter metallilatus TaxID=2493666 RepID=A0A3R9MYS8_9BACT|nr:hypothetical protein [Hymenobacter metallilatus]RSK33982.1 hypothetical protein EI290_09770 [Hymenobacter metallilatus]
MKKIRLIFSLLSLFCCVNKAVAQTEDSEEQVPGLELLKKSGADLNAAAAAVLPVANKAILVQVGSANQATLQQVGTGNVILAEQMGTRNAQSVTQRGTGNTVVSTIEGNGTTSSIQQAGSYNTVTQELQVDNRRYTVQQQGANNQLTQRESGVAAPPGYDVKMQGNGIRLTIDQGVKTFQP